MQHTKVRTQVKLRNENDFCTRSFIQHTNAIPNQRFEELIIKNTFV